VGNVGPVELVVILVVISAAVAVIMSLMRVRA
jgi:hypothetical protein